MQYLEPRFIREILRDLKMQKNGNSMARKPEHRSKENTKHRKGKPMKKRERT